MDATQIRTTERFEHSTLPMALLSLDGELVRVNRALCRLVGIAEPELLGLRTHELGTSEQDQVIAQSALAEARSGVKGGEFVQTWADAKDPALREIHVRVAWSLMHDPAGAPWYISVICVDESIRVKAERDRAREAARFRGRFEQSTVPQALLDLQSRFVEVNQAYCDLVGVAAEHLRGQPVASVNHPLDQGVADLALARLLAGELTVFEAERVIVGADGQPVPVRVNAALIRDQDGAPESAAVYYQDLSALRGMERQRQAQEDLLLALSVRASDLALVSDAEGRLTYVSPSVTSLLGYDLGEVVGESGWSFLHPDDEVATRAVFERVLARGGSETVDIRVRTAAGTWLAMEETLTNLLDTPVGGIVCNLRDITERRAAETAMRASESRLRTIVDNAQEGIWAAGPDGSTLYMNLRMAAIIGVERRDMHERSKEIWSRFSTKDLRSQIALASRPERLEVDYDHPDGGNRRLSLTVSPLRDESGQVEGSLAMITDVTEARSLEQELRHAALHDSLTGLPNRALLVDRLEHALARDSGRTAVLLVDLDHFKVVNDSLGHAAGDELLVAVTERLVRSVRPQDTVARFGGDEFVIVCEDTDEVLAQELATGLLGDLEVPFDLLGDAVHVSGSIGVALSPADSAGDLLRFADAAMYSAKQSGRRRVRVFDSALAHDVEQRYRMHADLHEALTQDLMVLHYQPVIDLASGRVLGVEALARWSHPTHGDVPPSRFVPLAEQTGLAVELDRWAVRRALREMAVLRAASALPADAYVAVNLSAGHLGDQGLADLIIAASAAAGLPPELVVLEITESTLMEDMSVAVPVLQQLRAQGFQVAVDDFGTGYSSLGYLRDLPITTLKIDRTFVTGLVDDPDALAIVASIVDLAKAIGLGTIAEGVETQQQADRLLGLGCTAAQGWLWSRAIAPEQIADEASWRSPFSAASPAKASGRSRGPSWTAEQVRPEHGLDRLLELHRGGASLSTITAALNREGFANPQGARWHRAGVAHTISTIAYPQLND